SKYKILWILRESRDDYTADDKMIGGGWSLPNVLNEKIEIFRKGFKDRAEATYIPIIYTTYSIINGFLSYKEMGSIQEHPAMADSLKNIAIINIKKTPRLKQIFDPE